MLLDLEDNISDLRDADLAELLTKLEFLMTNKEAAQATFTRITLNHSSIFLVNLIKNIFEDLMA